MCCTIFLNEKTRFEAIKTRSSNIWIIEIFPKRLTHGFGQKLPIFPIFFWGGGNIGEENVFYDIVEPKKRLAR